MTRTPDEIKKGLDFCSRSTCGDKDIECPYECGNSTCITHLTSDALALIRWHEEKNEAMHAEIVRLQAERDALMHWAKGRCDTCAHKYDCVKHDPDPEGYVMRWYDDCEIWEWRGAQKEE